MLFLESEYEPLWNATSTPLHQSSREAPPSYPVPAPRTESQRPVPVPRKISLSQSISEPKFRGENFRFLKVLGKGSFGKVCFIDFFMLVSRNSAIFYLLMTVATIHLVSWHNSTMHHL